ncbi:MAG: phosphatidylserine decarboxylase [Gammaproteobacteria bacterium]|nr:phosphatidylserine decarboxylase [Gammaproteobacteria bacterium]
MSGHSPHLIAREGWWHVGLAIAAALVVQGLAGLAWALPLWLLVVFVLQFFRDPARRIPSEPLGVVSPADGRIVFAGPAQDPFLERPAQKISVFMNVFNVHSNRSPVAGTVRERWYTPGRFFNAALDKASEKNERNALWIRTDEGDDVTCVQIAGLVARRILCYSQPGERLEQGQRFGFIRFGSRVDVYLPENARVTVAPGQKVSAGSDLLGYLVR